MCEHSERRIITTEQSCILTGHYFGPFRIIFAKGSGLGWLLQYVAVYIC